MARLVDTNILVYRFDPRDPVKQRIASDLLRHAVIDGDLVLPHQAILEFVAAVKRPRPDLDGAPLLSAAQAVVEAEELMFQFPVVYPGAEVLLTALRGMATYQLSWFDAHLWAYAEVHGLPEILSEDFEHGRHYGRVRTVDPFLAAADSMHELPPLYADPESIGK
ncbi:PIN domain-containing protein [Salinisphaera sp. PC39]|uniref:PIN domain-containing protein n=1 Tax=Salinisphaera sp. PC39 TaxID=1304156 RepID=UPI00333E9D28